MNLKRYIARHEQGADYAVIDTGRPGQPSVATGLTSDEADEAASRLNQSEHE